ncbi:MAG: hypothetical protein K8I00_01175 [Candidatus Omnitrophica bacterium]|nr:hypothetical protein [Candidatus Omnitrophota bacterium]
MLKRCFLCTWCFFLIHSPAWASITQTVVLPQTIIVYAICLSLIGFTFSLIYPKFVFINVFITILLSSRAILVCNDPFVGRDLMIQYSGRYELYAVAEILVILISNFMGSIIGNFRTRNTLG